MSTKQIISNIGCKSMFQNQMRSERSPLLGLVGAVWTRELRLLAALVALMQPDRALVLVHLTAAATREQHLAIRPYNWRATTQHIVIKSYTLFIYILNKVN